MVTRPSIFVPGLLLFVTLLRVFTGDLAPAPRTDASNRGTWASHTAALNSIDDGIRTVPPSRPFVVSAGDVDVRVLGTRFRVRIEDRNGDVRAGVRVLVSRGTVEVSGPYDRPPIRVHAGEERWLASDLNTLPTSTESPPLHDGQRLFEQANLARRSGHAREAARLYDLLLARFPSDDRAGLAALELGRLRMNALGDLRGAVAALREAAKTIPHGSLHEDAQARLVDALDGLRDRDGCRRARA